jgi:hypothetical protein
VPRSDAEQFVHRNAGPRRAYAEAGADAVWIGLATAQDYDKGGRHGEEAADGRDRWREFPRNRSRDEGSSSRRRSEREHGQHRVGAIDKALVELKTTGRMAEAQKGALSR